MEHARSLSEDTEELPPPQRTRGGGAPWSSAPPAPALHPFSPLSLQLTGAASALSSASAETSSTRVGAGGNGMCGGAGGG
jgi:hypothetical protein